MTSPSPTPLQSILKKAAFPAAAAALGVLFLLLLHLTWLKWGDPIIDTGRELEIPWKISLGDLLYRDMAYNYGPFSPYWNALFLKIFGVQLHSIVWSGVLCALAGLVLVFLAARVFLGRAASLCLAALFLFESAFQHYYMNGNFNFILPYSFPAVHGILFALAAFLCLSRHLDSRGRIPLVAAGILAGLCLLCKIEIAAALLVPLAILPAGLRIREGRGLKTAVRDTAAWAVPCLGVVLAGFLPFLAETSFQQVVWRNVLKPQLVDFSANAFFMKHLGLSEMQNNITKMVVSMALWGTLLALIAAGVAMLRKGSARGRTTAIVLATASITAAALFVTPLVLWELRRFELYDVEFRCLPLIGLLATAGPLAALLFRKKEIRPGEAKLLAFSLFALLCLVRIFFSAGTFHYGFCLALPGVILFAVFLLKIPPRWFPILDRAPRFYEATVLCILLAFSARDFVVVSMDAYGKKNVTLSGPGGTLKVLPFPFGTDLKSAMAFLDKAGAAGDTLLVLPEDGAVNFLTLQPNPLYYDLFTPPELNGPGVEQDVIDGIGKAKVKRIMVVDRPVWEYGCRGLGIDYGTALMQYVKDHYTEEAAFGPPPYGSVPGGCRIYRLRE